MKKTYEKPQIWAESFIMDASIAADAPTGVEQDVWNEFVSELQGMGLKDDELEAALRDVFGGNDGYCYHTLGVNFMQVS